MNKEQLDTVDRVLTSLINNPKYGTVGLTLNDHVQCSQGGEPMREYTVKECMDDPNFREQFNWYADADTAKAIEHNTFWSLQWYPDTPVGSYHSNAFDLGWIVEDALLTMKKPGFDYDLIHDFELFLRKYLRAPIDGLTLQYNDHKTYYQETSKRVADCADNTWVSPEERSNVIATDRLWEFYQRDTQPVRASSLASLFLLGGFF
jgi:hypothetical protein